MKPPKEPTNVFEGAQHQSQDPVLVSIAQGPRASAVVAVEWRDGAGELHREVFSPELSAEYLAAV